MKCFTIRGLGFSALPVHLQISFANMISYLVRHRDCRNSSDNYGIQCRECVAFQRFKTLHYAYMAMVSLRMIILYMLSSYTNIDIVNGYVYIDPLLVTCLSRFRFFDPMTILIFSPVPFFLYYFDTNFYFGFDRQTICILYDITNINGKDFWRLNVKPLGVAVIHTWWKCKTLIRAFIRLLLGKAALFTLDNDEKMFRFYQPTLPSFPDLVSARIRINLIVMNEIGQLFMSTLLIVACKSLFVFLNAINVLIFCKQLSVMTGIWFFINIVFVAARETLPNHSIGLSLIVFFDGFAILYVFWNAVRMCTFIIFGIAMIIFGKSMQLYTSTNNLNSFLPTVVERIYTEAYQLKTKERSLNKIMYSYLCKRIVAKLRGFMQTHSSIFIYALNLNRRLTAKLMLVAFAATVGANIHIIAMLVYLPLMPVEQYLLLGAIILQIFISLATLQTLITFSNALHTAKGPIYSLQLMLHVDSLRENLWLREKIKLMHYYEQLNSKNRFYFTLGNIASISRRSFYEVITKIWYRVNQTNELTFCAFYLIAVYLLLLRVHDVFIQSHANSSKIIFGLLYHCKVCRHLPPLTWSLSFSQVMVKRLSRRGCGQSGTQNQDTQRSRSWLDSSCKSNRTNR